MTYIDSLTPDARWFDAPRERTPQFFRTYSQVSIALQEALRQLAPAEFFADLANFKNQRAGYAMLAYAASRPFRPKTRTDFTYDVTNSGAMAMFYRFSRGKFIAALTECQARLLEAGYSDIAQLYEPRDIKWILKAVKKQKRFRRPIHRLLVSEGRLLNELTAFSGLDQCSPKEQRKRAALIMRRWRRILQRLCLGSDFRCIAAPLLSAATQAYVASKQDERSGDLLDLAA